jgi:hypothetical protein
MLPYCFHLDDSFIPLKDMAILDQYDKSRGAKYLIDLEHASEKLLSYNSDTFQLVQIELFVTPAGFRLGAHIDSDSPEGSCKLNFSYGSESSLMEWYRTKENCIGIKEYIDHDSEQDEVPTISFKPSDVNVIYSSKIETPSIVNVSIPHGLNNESSQTTLITIACIFQNKFNKIKIEQAIQQWVKENNVYRS